MPEPNLPLLHVGYGCMTHGAVNVDEVKRKIPTLPEEKRSNLKETFSLSPEQAYILVVRNEF